MSAPNYRYVDCCLSCVHITPALRYHSLRCCKKHNIAIFNLETICDDYEKKEIKNSVFPISDFREEK